MLPFAPCFASAEDGQPGIPFDHRSLWQPDPAQQVGVTWIGADIVERRVKFEGVDMIACGSSLLQSRERSILLAEHGVARGRAVMVACGFANLGIFSQDSRVPRLLENLSEILSTRIVAS